MDHLFPNRSRSVHLCWRSLLRNYQSNIRGSSGISTRSTTFPYIYKRPPNWHFISNPSFCRWLCNLPPCHYHRRPIRPPKGLNLNCQMVLTHVTRKRSITTFPYCLGTVNLSEVHSYRYLGVTITNKLNWSNHILKLTADASKSLNYLRRSLYLSPPSIRKIAYETFIRTKLEYASSIWNPHQTYLADILEAVQNRATRFISSKYGHTTSVTHLKASVGLPLLASRRKISLLCLFHKLYYNFPDLRSTLLFPPVRSSHRLFNSMSIQRLHGSTNAFNKSFLPVAIEQWNSLPESVVAEHNPSKFRELLSSYILN